jgi:transcriptional regulator with XRE-family HTH domain
MINNRELKLRNDNICLLKADGMTYQAIADLYGISRGRVSQIFENHKQRKKSKPWMNTRTDAELCHENPVALADYLRHKVSVDNPKDQYFVDLAAEMLEEFAKQIKNEQ